MERWRGSGLTAGEFARKHGVREQTLRWWKWRLGSEPHEGGALRPARTPSEDVSPLTFVEMMAGMPSEPLEVVLASGVRIRVPSGFDASTLERLLDVVERRS